MVAEEVERMMDQIAALRRENAALQSLVADLIRSAQALYQEMAAKEKTWRGESFPLILEQGPTNRGT